MKKIKVINNDYFKGDGYVEFVVRTEEINFNKNSTLIDETGKKFYIKTITPQITSPIRISEVFLDSDIKPIGSLYVEE